MSAKDRVAQVVEEFAPRLLGYFVRRVAPREDAADLLSQTLALLWRKVSVMPDDPDHLTGWVYSIAAGVLANHRRSIARRSRLSVKLRDELRDSESDDGVLDLRLDIAAAVDKLDPQSAELVRLIYWDRLSATDAGAVLGLSGSGARAKAAAARATLADLLTRYPGSQ